jgi:hypothetical protein
MRLSAHGGVATHSLIQHRFLFFKGASGAVQNAHIFLQMTEDRRQMTEIQNSFPV